MLATKVYCFVCSVSPWSYTANIVPSKLHTYLLVIKNGYLPKHLMDYIRFCDLHIKSISFNWPIFFFVVWWYTPIDKNFSDRVFKLHSPQGIHVRFICAILLMAMAVFLKTRLFGMKNPHGFNVGHSHLLPFLFCCNEKEWCLFMSFGIINLNFSAKGGLVQLLTFL